MMYKIIKEKFILLKLAVVIIMSVLLISYGKIACAGGLKGLYLCSQVLIPSLFPYMILANFTVKSGVSDFIGKYLGFISKIFGVSKSCTAVILLGFMGGFPVGAKGVSALYESGKISKMESEKLSYSLVCAGPGFLLVFVGSTLLNSVETGACILISQIISALILGLVGNLVFKKDDFNSNTEIKGYLPISEALINSVSNATYSMIDICAMVVLFSSFISILEKLLPINIYTYLASILEVTTASSLLCNNKNIILLAFAVGFGGLSIHFQIFQALKNLEIKKWLFEIFRLFQGILTAAFTFLFIKLFRITIPVYSSIREFDYTLSTSVMGSILLILTGLCFLSTLKNYKN